MRRLLHLIVATAVVLILASCFDVFTADLNSPMDPEADAYQGYETVSNADDIAAASQTGAQWVIFTASEVVGATAYHLQVTTTGDSAFAAPIVDNATFSTNVMAVTGDFTAGTTYRWRARAQKGGAWGAWSDVATASFAGVADMEPADGESTTDTTPTLRWDAVIGADHYEVQIASTAAGVAGATPVTVNAPARSYTWPTVLSAGDKLHWRLRAVAAGGTQGAWSSIADLTYYGPWNDTYWSFQSVIASGSTGTFSMGSTSGDSDERPVHSVTLTRPYRIGTYEVTNDQFAAVMNEALDRGWVTASTSTVRNVSGSGQELLDVDDSDCRIDYSGGNLVVNAGYGNHPVTEVTWYGAVAFAYYLNELESREQTYSLSDWSMDATKGGYRLPTEAEWEYAARGGASSGGYTYAGSNTVGAVAWYTGNSGGRTHTVGTKAANEIGTYDMSGNLWEWVNDWYGSTYYSISPGTNPEGPASGTSRVFRGGSWAVSSSYLHVAYRHRLDPNGSGGSGGFRLVVGAAP